MGTGDSFTAQVLLSETDTVLNTARSFVLREFDLGQSGLGANLKPNETINLDWIQQLPDNYEGDYYLVVRITDDSNGGADSFPLSNTPVVSLTSKNAGTTFMQAPGRTVDLERPHANGDGTTYVYERAPSSGIDVYKQIYLRNRFLESDPPENLPSGNLTDHGTLLSESILGTGQRANGNSHRPRISADGSTVVFHSMANDLVFGDNNGQSDVFIYSVQQDQLKRVMDFNNLAEANGGSFYADVNGDGTKVVFESVATNLQTSGVATSGRQIFLLDMTQGENGTIRAITSGNGDSARPTIDDAGKYVTFSSDATNLNATNLSSDENGQTDVFVFNTEDNSTHCVSLNYFGIAATGGVSDQAEISGDGSTIAYRSKATNLVTGKGISSIEVVGGGVGYLGNPTIVVTDSTGTGSGAVLSLQNGTDAYGQIQVNGVTILDAGRDYREPVVTVVPDPNQPAPVWTATIVAHLSHPEGDLYKIKVADLNGTTTNAGSVPLYSVRISEKDGVGGDMPSRDPSISYDGKSIVYSTQSSNLLDLNVTRADGSVYYNAPVRQALAEAVLVGGIGEIEVQDSGSGYQSGFLRIEDFSGSGSGAVASYQVDSFGRISSITMVAAGADYDLDSTVVSVDNPRGGTGFVAGEVRFPKESGIGQKIKKEQ
jgi:hypothetical protein